MKPAITEVVPLYNTLVMGVNKAGALLLELIRNPETTSEITQMACRMYVRSYQGWLEVRADLRKRFPDKSHFRQYPWNQS